MKGACEKKWIFFIHGPTEYIAARKDAGNYTRNNEFSGKKIFFPVDFYATRQLSAFVPTRHYRLYLPDVKPYKRRRMPPIRPTYLTCALDEADHPVAKPRLFDHSDLLNAPAPLVYAL